MFQNTTFTTWLKCHTILIQGALTMKIKLLGLILLSLFTVNAQAEDCYYGDDDTSCAKNIRIWEDTEYDSNGSPYFPDAEREAEENEESYVKSCDAPEGVTCVAAR